MCLCELRMAIMVKALNTMECFSCSDARDQNQIGGLDGFNC